VRRPSRTIALSAAAVLALAGAGWAFPELTSDLGLDVWNMPGLRRQMDQDRRQIEEMKARCATVMRRIQYKTGVVDDVIAGRATLFAAAAQFRDLDGDQFIALFRRQYPGRNDDERFCRNVIDFVAARSSNEPSAARALTRLTNQLEQELARGGEIHLPD
jgi:hypothetical protein